MTNTLKSNSTGLIKVWDFAQRLEYMHHQHDQYLEHFSKEDFDREFDDVCRKIFGATLDDIPEDHFINLERLPINEAAVYAKSCGFDLFSKPRRLVRDWKAFALMIRARETGLLPQSKQTLEQTLSKEVEQFIKSKGSRLKRFYGRVTSFNQNKGYGFIFYREDYSEREIFVHKSEAEKAGINIYERLDISFNIEEGKNGKPRAVNLRTGINISERGFVSRRQLIEEDYREIEREKWWKDVLPED